MKPEPIPATPSLMTLLCIIGGAMRGEGPVNLGLMLLVIGTMVPEIGYLIKTWVRLEERAEAGLFWAVGPCADDTDGESTAELRSGWVRREGRVWLWRHVTPVCTVIIPVRLHFRVRNAHSLRRGRVWSPCWVLSALSFPCFFALAVAASPNCALFVPVS
jgi:hypothetical protein